MARGVLRAIHATDAFAVDGVVGVWFESDIPGDGHVGPIVHDEPLLAEEQTCYFPSRLTPPAPLAGATLSELVNHWLNHLLEEDIDQPPCLVCNSEGSGYNALCRALKATGADFTAVVNFGVGNDPRKQLPPAFEEALILRLLEEPGTIVFLDSGRGPDEARRVAAIGEAVRRRGLACDFLSEHEVRAKAFTFGHGLIAFKGSIESLGNLISAADCFIGYDSCGQHIAAATGTPAVIVFAGAPSARFLKRWAPAAAHNHTIAVRPTDDINDILELCSRHLCRIREERQE